MTRIDEDRKPVAVQAAVYAVAFFTGSPFIMLSVIMPLWALELGSTPLVIGLIISSRQILVITMAVHGGALLDRFGPRVVISPRGCQSAPTQRLVPVVSRAAVIVVLAKVFGFIVAGQCRQLRGGGKPFIFTGVGGVVHQRGAFDIVQCPLQFRRLGQQGFGMAGEEGGYEMGKPRPRI